MHSVNVLFILLLFLGLVFLRCQTNGGPHRYPASWVPTEALVARIGVIAFKYLSIWLLSCGLFRGLFFRGLFRGRLSYGLLRGFLGKSFIDGHLGKS